MSAQRANSTGRLSRSATAICIAIALACSSARGERAYISLEQAVSVADHIVAGEVLAFDPPDAGETPSG